MRILLVATVQSHICQFHLPLIKMLKEEGHTVEVAAKNNLDIKPGLSLELADKVYDIPFARSPFAKTNLKALKQMKQLLSENHYDVIHCNTPMGGVITRLAGKKSRKNGTKIIYTAHGFHFFNGAPKKNWLMYYPMEWWLSHRTDLLICINKEDYNRACKKFHAKRTEYVRGVGFDANRCVKSHTKEEARQLLGIEPDAKVLFSIGELNARKNHQVTIKAIAKLNDEKIKWFVAGNGPMEDELKQLVKTEGVENSAVFLGYTRKITQYFEAADIFVFPSLQEGLPIALMETMSFGLPVVASDIRGTNDLICDGDGGFLLGKYDSDGFAEKIRVLLEDPELAEKFSKRNQLVAKDFEIPPVIEHMKRLYAEMGVK